VKADIATLVKAVRELLKLAAIPQVAAKLELLKRIDSEDFWKEMDVLKLEHIRRELRGLMQFLDPAGKRPLILTSLTDPVEEQKEGEILPAEDVFENYEKKVNRYIEEHRNTLAIHNLTHNIPLTRKDYEELERVFTQELGSREDYQKAFKDRPFGLQVRKIAKMDHEAALAAFSEFINDNSLNSRQIEFVKKVITHIEQNGYFEDLSILGKPPFDKPARLVDFDVARRKRLVEVIEEVKGNALVM
jgi:type I restriction enzyme R subunit